jgi:hypothetical protein
MQVIYRLILLLISPLSLLLAYVMLNFAARYALLSRKIAKKGDGMSLLIDWAKVLFGIGTIIATSYAYVYLANGSGIINLLITIPLTFLAILVLLIVYWLELDELKENKKYIWPRRNFWLLAIYLFSPVLCNWASIGLKWGGYEAAAYYIFKLRYWTLLGGLFLWLLYYFVAAKVRMTIKNICCSQKRGENIQQVLFKE